MSVERTLLAHFVWLPIQDLFFSSFISLFSEIREYAIRIGIDPEAEPHLLPIARDGVMKALPPNWFPM